MLQKGVTKIKNSRKSKNENGELPQPYWITWKNSTTTHHGSALFAGPTSGLLIRSEKSSRKWFDRSTIAWQK
jgi:hypothetical protein